MIQVKILKCPTTNWAEKQINEFGKAHPIEWVSVVPFGEYILGVIMYDDKSLDY